MDARDYCEDEDPCLGRVPASQQAVMSLVVARVMSMQHHMFLQRSLCKACSGIHLFLIFTFLPLFVGSIHTLPWKFRFATRRELFVLLLFLLTDMVEFVGTLRRHCRRLTKNQMNFVNSLLMSNVLGPVQKLHCNNFIVGFVAADWPLQNVVTMVATLTYNQEKEAAKKSSN